MSEIPEKMRANIHVKFPLFVSHF